MELTRIIPAPILLMAACASLFLAVAQDQGPARAQTLGNNPALADLEIDIWPEFDQESSVLVILRAELAADATLPAEISVRLPAASGGPTAVAEAETAESQLLSIPYDAPNVQIDFITVTFQVTRRFFHIEFYDPVSTAAPDRAYEYLWPGDFAAAKVTVQLQEPAGSSNLSVTPDLGAPAVRADQLNYREAELGALEAGKPLSIDLQYQKSDARTTADIMGFVQATPPPSSDDDSGPVSSTVLIIVGVVAAAVLAAAIAFIVSKRTLANAAPTSRVQRRRAAPAEPKCTKCSASLQPGARFCASCGHPVKSKH
jgi:hypothetical protein